LDEDWTLLQCKSQLLSGKYADAKQTIEKGFERFPNSVRLRRLAIQVYNFNGDTKRSLEVRNEITELWKRNSWRYRDIDSMMVIGRHLLDENVDPKTVLDELYNKAKEQFPQRPETYIAIGDLALDKNDYQLAAKNFSKAIKIDPDDPDIHIGLAKAYRPSNSEKATASLNAALAINPNHSPSLLLKVEQQMNAEDYPAAEASIEKILVVNPHQPDAWAYRAALAHLANDPAEESKCRTEALKFWKSNPGVDHLIGLQLSRKYRFQESSVYQRRSLMYDPAFVPAKIQLAHDLLRLGQELEGWKLAEEVFDADQYNVVANNLVALRDNMSKFTTIERDGFVVRMDKQEAEVYGHMVMDLIVDAEEKLTKKYNVVLQKPIFIEIFPRQQDFAIRTFGLPGGDGFLGVCFGRVVTMNSPTALNSTTNWRSVLWHEFCHVVTLQKTANKMPRWLSEGISVYEEGVENSAWGDSINADYREMILGEDLTPISQLSSAFLNVETPMHLQFAYYESSMVVRFLIAEYGEPAMSGLLDELSLGTPINDALARHMAPTDFLDKSFEKHIKKIANEFAAEADWTKPESPIDGTADWQAWLSENPDNIYGLLGLASSQLKSKQYEDALTTVKRFEKVYPHTKGAEQAILLKASALRNLDREVDEIKALEQVLTLAGDELEACSRLLDIYSANSQWRDVVRVAEKIQGINPMLKSSHAALALAGEKLNNDSLVIESLSALATMNPFDRADTHFRLASAQFRQSQVADAKRNVLLALDAAPRYRDAHQLLLQIMAKQDGETKDKTETSKQSLD
jgi:tetratricopeptide (TPR) repeat protein